MPETWSPLDERILQHVLGRHAARCRDGAGPFYSHFGFNLYDAVLTSATACRGERAIVRAHLSGVEIALDGDDHRDLGLSTWRL